MQFKVITEALKDSLSNLGFDLDNSVSVRKGKGA